MLMHRLHPEMLENGRSVHPTCARSCLAIFFHFAFSRLLAAL